MYGVLVWLLVAFTGSIGAQRLVIQPLGDKIEKQEGANLALTCRPDGEDPAQYTNIEWRDPINRVINTRDTSKEIYIQNLAADKSVVLIFNGIREKHDGNYTCYASYANSMPLTKSISVKTFVDVTFVDAPEDQYPVVGKEFKVKCKVVGKPSPLMYWQKNGEAISPENDKYIIANDGLIIKNVTEADDGDYKCTAVVENTGMFHFRNIKVEVHVPPTIEQLAPVTIVEGESASIKCTATGKPSPTYTWIKERDRQDLSKTPGFIVRKNTGELVINRVEFNDDGIYQCTAENSVDRAETTVKVNVLVKPNIYELLNATAAIKSETTIVCKVKGRPPPRVTFRKLSSKEPLRDGRQPNDTRIILEQTFDQEKGEAFGTLTITNLTRTDDGLYECIAKNSAGEAYKNGHITVRFPPTFERTKDLPPVWTWNERPGNLSCLPEAIPNATITWRWNTIEINEENMARGLISQNNFKVMGKGPQSFLIVSAFSEKKYYTNYECIARNELGQDSVKIELRQAFPPGPPSQVRAAQITATTIKFSILPPAGYFGPPIRSYTVQFRPDRQMSWDYASNHTWSAGAPYILEGLIPEMTYHFRVAARNDVDLGAYYNAPSVTMPSRSVPAEPRILVSHQDENSSSREISTVSPYADHFELRWSVPADNGDPIQYYLVRFCVIEKVTGEWRDVDCSEQLQRSAQETKYELNDLRPDTVYKIELRAHNSMGDSSPAQLRVRTARGIDPVVPVQKPMMSSSAIVGIVVVAILIVLVIVDFTCFVVNRTGIIALCCDRTKSKKAEEEDPKLGREEMEPLKPTSEEKPMRVEYDGNRVYSKSGEIIGKHSAV